VKEEKGKDEEKYAVKNGEGNNRRGLIQYRPTAGWVRGRKENLRRQVRNPQGRPRYEQKNLAMD